MIPNNAWTIRITAAAGTNLAGPSFGLDQIRRSAYFLTLTAVYTPRGFILHAASLRQTFVHCAIFVTAAPRGGPGSVSVPMWRINLSIPLRVDALVSRYLTNKLIRHRPLPDQPKPLIQISYDIRTSSGITGTFAKDPKIAAIPMSGVRCLCITHPFATKFHFNYSK